MAITCAGHYSKLVHSATTSEVGTHLKMKKLGKRGQVTYPRSRHYMLMLRGHTLPLHEGQRVGGGSWQCQGLTADVRWRMRGKGQGENLQSVLQACALKQE